MPDPFDLVIRGVTRRGEAADIGMRDGRIARIGRDLTGLQGLPADGQPVAQAAAPSRLVLPQGVRIASREQVARAWLLGLALFIGTLGIGYVTWSLRTSRPRTPPASSRRCASRFLLLADRQQLVHAAQV
jgi:hypothetical protein